MTTFDSSPKRAGMLAPVFALRHPDDLGIGDTQALSDLIEWAADHELQVIQFLPIQETGDDNSPYNAISSRAICPTTIHISPDKIPGLLPDDLPTLAPAGVLAALRADRVRYSEVKTLKLALLRRAFDRFHGDPDFDAFQKKEAAWLEPYSLFRALIDANNGSAVWEGWPNHLRTYQAAGIWFRSLHDDAPEKKTRQFHAWVQWLAHKQWMKVRALADRSGIQLFGDIPFGLNRCSADVWHQPELFNLSWFGGAPPEPWFQHDPFIQKWGQNWGIPLYCWDEHAKHHYVWWRQRLAGLAQYCHLIRIDHILGFFRIYSFPWHPAQNDLYLHLSHEEAQQRSGHLPQFLPHPDDTPHHSHVNEHQGIKHLHAIISGLGDTQLIGEDLGVVPPYVRPALTSLGIPGFKIPMFERDYPSNQYIPSEKIPALSVATLGTHDHAPIKTMWNEWTHAIKEGKDGGAAHWEKTCMSRWAKLPEAAMQADFDHRILFSLVNALHEMPSNLSLLQVTDWFGNEQRFNSPGPAGEGNWTARIAKAVRDWDNDPEWLQLTKAQEDAIISSGRGRV
jgi:4-alpha-glucanotransferase